jgi:hypothetical protein
LILSQLVYLVKFRSFDDMTTVISLISTNFLLLLKSLNFVMNVEEIEDLFELVEEANKKFGEGKELKNMKFIDRILKCIWLQGFTGCLFSIMVPITTSELANQLWYPFEFEKGGVVFWAIAVFQTVNICVVSGVDVVLEFVPTILSGAILDMLQQLSKQLEELTQKQPLPATETATSRKTNEIRNSKRIAEKFKSCIMFHLKIMDIMKQLEGIFSSMYLTHAVVSTMILCTSAYKLSMVSFMRTLHHENCPNFSSDFNSTKTCRVNFLDRFWRSNLLRSLRSFLLRQQNFIRI